MYTCEKCGKPNIIVDDMSSPLISDYIEVCHECKTQVHVINNYGYEWTWNVIDEPYDEEYAGRKEVQYPRVSYKRTAN